MLLNTGFMFVCVLLMIPISFISWLKSGDDYKRLLEAVPVASIGYATTVVISIGLFSHTGRDLITIQGFCISMASQLVGILICGVIVHLESESLRRDEVIMCVSSTCAVPSVVTFWVFSNS